MQTKSKVVLAMILSLTALAGCGGGDQAPIRTENDSIDIRPVTLENPAGGSLHGPQSDAQVVAGGELLSIGREAQRRESVGDRETGKDAKRIPAHGVPEANRPIERSASHAGYFR